uniref:Uncharacterized protein n=1 Tax=Lutzomyia longipalpis TaxID=7200 RepID=A0A1B0CNG3_LUTLO
MQDAKRTYLISNVANGNKVLTDSMEFVPLFTNPDDAAKSDVIISGPNSPSVAQEILMVGLGCHGNRPLLFIRTEIDAHVYRVFRYPRGHLKIRFRKMLHEMMYQKIVPEGERFVSQLRYFGNIFGYNGVTVCGRNPYFVLLTPKGEFRTHRLYGKGVIKSFAAFNNVNCPNGFLYFDDSSELKIAVFPKYLTYDPDWPVRKIPLRCTPMQICYHTERKIYCLVTNTSEVSQKYFRFNGEDKELTEENKGERFIYPAVDKFTVVLVAPTSWEIVPSAQIDLDEWEHVTAFKNVSLLYEGTRSGLKEYICIGTNYNYSEDITSRGRILIYDIIEVVPEPGKPLTRYRFKEVYTKEQKGPVSAITHVLGFLVTAVGQKIYLWQLKKGVVLTLALREAKGAPRLAVNKNTVSPQPAVTALCAYRDTSGMFTSKFEDFVEKGQGGLPYGGGFGYMKPEPHMKVEDEEDLLYGDAGNSFKVTSMAEMAVGSKATGNEWWRKYMQTSKPTYWLFVARANGNLEIYSMPDLKLTYLISNVANGNKVLTDSMDSPSVAQEILMVGLGCHGNRPLLFIRTEIDVHVYRVFRYPRGHLKIRFRKMLHEMMYQKIVPEGERFVSQLRYFGNIFGYNGVTVCGRNPYFVLLTPKGEFRTHRLYGKGVIKSFAAFNNVNCPNGFLYFDDSSELKIAVFPKYLTYDADWPVRKIPLRCTPMQICYHTERKIYCLVTNTSEVSQKYFRFNGEDKELTEENKGERFIYPAVDKFTVVLVAPTSWEIVPSAQIDLDEWEHEYICIGTNYNYSEDITSRGRILIYDIIEVVPEPGKPLTRYRFKEVYTKEQKGPVSAITHVLGFLVTAVGQKIYLWQLKDGDLVGVAFIDTNIYVHEMVSIKSIILVADVYKSISVLRFQEEYRTLSLVTRDFQAQTVFSAEYVVDNHNLGFLDGDLVGVAFIDTNIYVHEMVSIKSIILVADVYKSISVLRFQEEYRTLSLVTRDFQAQTVFSAEYVVDNHNLGFLVTDGDGNIIIYMYQPESRESFGGQRLLRKADYHLGQRINAMFRIQCNLHDSHREQMGGRAYAGYDQKHITFFGTLDGGLGFCLPLPEKTYRLHRTIKTAKRMQANPARCIVDGDLIWSFINLPMNEKIELSKKIGTRVDEIYSDLAEIHSVTSIF